MSLLRTQHLQVMAGEKLICHALDLTLEAGKVWGVLGANGSGKTTLLHTLANLHPNTSGTILLAEKDLKSYTQKAIAQQIGILFQDINILFPQTVWEYCHAGHYPHLSYWKKESAKDREITLQMLQIMGLDQLMHRDALQLSGGEKRRLALATLLTQRPSIYLLDEPTNHLDLRHQVQALEHLRYLAKTEQAAICMALHDVNLAQQYCDHILLLFPDGDTLQGAPCDVLTVAHLTRLYGCEMRAIAADSVVFWTAAGQSI